MSTAKVTMLRVRPAWGRVTVTESVVEEEQRASGILVPFTTESDEGDIKRGIVLHVGPSYPGGPDASDLLFPGFVVFYRHGTKIGDVTIVAFNDIIAWEES